MALSVGDYVSAKHSMSFLPQFAGKREFGVVSGVMDDGTIIVLWPVGKDDPRKHSQCAPYDAHELRAETKEDALANLPEVWASIDPMEVVEGAA